MNSHREKHSVYARKDTRRRQHLGLWPYLFQHCWIFQSQSTMALVPRLQFGFKRLDFDQMDACVRGNLLISWYLHFPECI